jgi:hypothetical protein
MVNRLLTFLCDLWLGFALLGALAGAAVPFVLLLCILYEMLK